MNLTLEREAPPWHQDISGGIRVGQTRVLLELVIHAFQDGSTPEAIIQKYPTLDLGDVYATIGYYLRHPDPVHAYLEEREQKAQDIEHQLLQVQPNLVHIRSRILNQKRN